MLFELTPLDVAEADRCLFHIGDELDFAMALMIQFEGKPETEFVSLVHGPQAELERAVDEYLTKHRYELTHRLKECPRCDYSVFRAEAPASCPKGCGALVDVKNLDLSEDNIRLDAESELTGPDLLVRRHANTCGRIVTEILKTPFPIQEDVKLSLDDTLQILSAGMQEEVVALTAIATKANDPGFFEDRTDLLPQGGTLHEMYIDYLSVRSKLEALGTWLHGLEDNHPNFADYPPEYPLTPFRLAPPVEFPINKSQAQVSHSADFTSFNWFGKEYRFARGNQAAAIRVLYEAYEAGEHSVHQETIREEIESAAESKFELRTVFRKRKSGGNGYDKHEAWGTLIQPGDRKGTFRLMPPENHS